MTQEEYDKQQRQYWLDYYGALKGATITEVGVDKDGFPFFVADKDGERIQCEISADPEGNGPGFLFGLPRPT